MIKDKSMGRKLIFLDIDGTLLPPGDMLIPESTLLHWIAPEQTDTSCFCAPAATTA